MPNYSYAGFRGRESSRLSGWRSPFSASPTRGPAFERRARAFLFAFNPCPQRMRTGQPNAVHLQPPRENYCNLSYFELAFRLESAMVNRIKGASSVPSILPWRCRDPRQKGNIFRQAGDSFDQLGRGEDGPDRRKTAYLLGVVAVVVVFLFAGVALSGAAVAFAGLTAGLTVAAVALGRVDIREFIAAGTTGPVPCC